MIQRRVAKIILTDNQNRCLLLHRSDNHPLYSHQVDLPGGVIEDDETFVDGIARELYEETMITLSSNPEKLFTKRIKFNQELITFSLFISKIEDFDRMLIVLSDEHEQWLTVPINNLVKYDTRCLTDNYVKYAINYIHNNQNSPI